MQSDSIRHVVVLMLENHSFDQMLGALRAELPDLEGVDPSNLRHNKDVDGRDYAQAVTAATQVLNDPMHEVVNVLRQLDDDNGNFVLDYSMQYPATTPDERQQIMGYYAPGGLPALQELARNFAVCDHWYSSVPGPTWTNRFFVHSGTSLGRVIMPTAAHPLLALGYDQDTVYDRLNDQGVPWRVYFGDIPQSLVLTHQRTARNALHNHRMSVFFTDAAGPEESFPAYSFIEPSYYWPGQNDDHPPHSTVNAQQLVAEIYNALRANEPLWESTLLVVLYDEHGGFYDHISPPAAVPPDGHTDEYTFDRLGVRIPALLVSPWVERTVIKMGFDHTSLLRYVSDKWGLGPLGERVATAQSFAGAIRATGGPRTDTPATIQLPTQMRELMAAAPGLTDAELAEPLNGHQGALVVFTEQLEQEFSEPAGKPIRAAAMAAGPLTRIATAKERIELFLGQQKAKPVKG
jgi:phospholipase C